MFGRKDKPQQSGQQRRADANRKADRAGQAAMSRSRRSGTDWNPSTTARAWWRSS